MIRRYPEVAISRAKSQIMLIVSRRHDDAEHPDKLTKPFMSSVRPSDR
jgi:hypothetical protein